MSSIPRDRKYTATHEWVQVEDNVATVGITDYAQRQLGDLTFVELPEPGTEIAAADELAVIESVKAASDIYAPVGGEVVEANTTLLDAPEAVNTDPYGDGWLFRIRMRDPAEAAGLLDADAYEELAPEDEEE